MITKEEYEKLVPFKKFVVTDEFGQSFRASKEDGGTMFVYAPKHSKRGWRYMSDYFCNRYTIKNIDRDAQWHRRIRRVIKCLSESGLWKDLVVKYKNLDTMTLQDKENIYQLYWNMDRHYSLNDPDSEKKEQEKVLKHFGEYVDRYPFIFPGKGVVETFYIWEMSEAKTKPMYFGKYRNSLIKREIAQAIAEKRAYSTNTRTSYDVHFAYDPENCKATYFEEYKGCGNGHYYIALNHSTALFCEND